ncbi:MAG TPA: hypothetical protein VK174_00880 [Chitinophagales bacterium]|nr:hypothetical protein [Chitinophagales bacterium]
MNAAFGLRFAFGAAFLAAFFGAAAFFAAAFFAGAFAFLVAIFNLVYDRKVRTKTMLQKNSPYKLCTTMLTFTYEKTENNI